MQMLTKILSKDRTLFFAIFCTIAILVLSLVNQIPQPENLELNDKVGHSIAYLFLSFFWLIYGKHKNLSGIKLFYIVLACFIYGIIIELMQHALTSTRTASVLDVIANTFGVITSYIIILVLKIKS